VDDPQKAIERAAGLLLELHGIHHVGKVHHDLKLENIMLEKQKIWTKIEAMSQRNFRRSNEPKRRAIYFECMEKSYT
jgi:tRNA A-37 threonylcarbamoyl transferase component Bud32